MWVYNFEQFWKIFTIFFLRCFSITVLLHRDLISHVSCLFHKSRSLGDLKNTFIFVSFTHLIFCVLRVSDSFSAASHLLFTSPNETFVSDTSFLEAVVDFLHFPVHFIFVIFLIYLYLEVMTT